MTAAVCFCSEQGTMYKVSAYYTISVFGRIIICSEKLEILGQNGSKNAVFLG